MSCRSLFAGSALLLVDVGRGTRIAREVAPYAQSQWLNREGLEAMQAGKLAALLTVAGKTVPRYADEAARGRWFRPGDSPRDFLATMPITTKHEMRSQPLAFRCQRGQRSRTFNRHTGGSTGTPFHYLADVPSLSRQWAAVYRAWEWSGYRFGDVMVTVGGASVASGGAGGIRSRVYNALRNNRAMAAGALRDSDLDAMLEGIARRRPALLYGYPSVIYLLARRALATGRDDVRPRAVVTTSEMLFPGQRKAIELALGTSVFDQYGCNEVNLVSAECERHDGLHYAMESTIVEIVDGEGRTVAPGAVGRIVGTSLDNLVMPFLRYDTGDMGALDPNPCECGRGLVRIRNLQGRSRDLVRTPDGRFIHGVEFNDLMLKFAAVERYQAVQLDVRTLRVVVGGDAAALGRCLDALRAQLASLTGLEVSVIANGELEYTAGSKVRVIVSHVDTEGGV